MGTRTKNKYVIFALIPAAITSVLLTLGGVGGYYIAIGQIRSRIQAHSANETLGALLNAEQKTVTARAYYNGQSGAIDMDAYSWVPPNVPTPFVGHGLRPGKSANAWINTMQFRADQEVRLPKPADVFRIFLTGGSTAYSSGAPSQDRTIAAYLAAMLNSEFSRRNSLRFEVFAAANPAWASTHERILIENRITELQPDLVVSLSGNNDVFWGTKGRDILWFRGIADELYFGILDTAYRKSGLGPLTDPLPPPRAVPAVVVGEKLEKNVRLAWYALSLRGTPYLFCLQPTLSTSRKILTDREKKLHPPSKEYYASCYGEIDNRLGHLRLRNFYYADLSDAFDKMGETDEIFIDSFHFGDRGNETVAHRIFLSVTKILK